MTMTKTQMLDILENSIIDRTDKSVLCGYSLDWALSYLDRTTAARGYSFSGLNREEITTTTISCTFTAATTDILTVSIDIPTGTKIVFDAGNIATISLGSGGTGYTAGDVITIVQSGGSGGTVTVSTVSSGVITAVALLATGSGYSVANGLAVTGGTGSGATINILTIGGTLPAGLIADTDYWAIRLSATTINVALSYLNAWIGTAVDISSTGTGTFTVTAYRERIAKPSECRYIYDVRLIDGAMSRKLVAMPARMTDLYNPFGAQESVGRPTHYTEWKDWLQLNKIPDATYVIQMRYYKWQTAFATTASTAEIENIDDIIISAAAMYVWKILGEPEQAAIMEQAVEVSLAKCGKLEKLKPDLVLKPNMGTYARSDSDSQSDPFCFSQR